MRKKAFLLALGLCFTTMFSTASAADVQIPLTAKVQAVATTDGVFKCTIPQVSGTKSAATDAAINKVLTDDITKFTNACNRLSGTFPKYDQAVDKAHVNGKIDYKVPCNQYTLLSIILHKQVNVPHKDGKVYTLDEQICKNFTTGGQEISSNEWSKLAKVAKSDDPFGAKNLKAAALKALKAKGLQPVKDYEENLAMAKDNYYLDDHTSLHALYWPGLVAPESAGWFDVAL